ncbi:MAG: hypothetical protein DI536_13655 [Archangium gephyra]|uniref:Uncharacterized protein n=1 Tax=Archangium gephyra TaxID=48 RepID=A0A2W5TKN4_9BACT|nr:MAG: hypothetical protein DI536_13655 [Archangium gephyra]
MNELREWGLIIGDEPLPTPLRRACHEGRLVGGLSLSLRALPDEVVSTLTWAVGVQKFRVLDVRTTSPMVMEIEWGELHETWEVEDVTALIDELNALFDEAPALKELVVLGEWEDMLQVWAVPKRHADEIADLSGRQ